MMEPPQQGSPGRDFNGAIEAEADERYRSRDQPSHDGYQTFEAVVTDGEVFELLAPAHEIRTGQSASIDYQRSAEPPS